MKNDRVKLIIGIILVILVIVVACLFISSYMRTRDTAAGEEALFHFIDVGQGDAFLAVCGDEFILVDAGPNSAEDDLVRYLREAGVDTLDYAIFTHPHEDHIGGADAVLDAFGAETVLLPKCDANTKAYERMTDEIEDCGAEVIIPSVGDSFAAGEMTFIVLAVDTEDDANNSSIVIRLTFGKNSLLLTGDIETEVEETIEKKTAVSSPAILSRCRTTAR